MRPKLSDKTRCIGARAVYSVLMIVGCVIAGWAGADDNDLLFVVGYAVAIGAIAGFVGTV